MVNKIKQKFIAIVLQAHRQSSGNTPQQEKLSIAKVDSVKNSERGSKARQYTKNHNKWEK